jgi:ribose transport system substrate-binding protein
MIAEGVDAIAFWPLDDSANDAVIERASDAGIPVFAHDAYADNLLDQVVTSVTHGRELRAKQGAQLICDQLSPDGGEILYGDFDVAIPTLVFLKEKFEQYLAECEAPIEIAAVFGNKTDDTEGGRAAAEPALLANPDVKAVFNYNDATAIGVAQAAEDLGMRDGLWIDGYNLGDDGIAALGSGRIDASWDYRGVQIGQALAKVMVDYASGANTEPAKVIMIWPRGYTPETIGELPTPDELIAQISEGVNLLEIDPDLYTESDTIPAPADNIPLPVVSN